MESAASHVGPESDPSSRTASTTRSTRYAPGGAVGGAWGLGEPVGDWESAPDVRTPSRSVAEAREGRIRRVNALNSPARKSGAMGVRQCSRVEGRLDAFADRPTPCVRAEPSPHRLVPASLHRAKTRTAHPTPQTRTTIANLGPTRARPDRRRP